MNIENDLRQCKEKKRRKRADEGDGEIKKKCSTQELDGRKDVCECKASWEKCPCAFEYIFNLNAMKIWFVVVVYIQPKVTMFKIPQINLSIFSFIVYTYFCVCYVYYSINLFWSQLKEKGQATKQTEEKKNRPKPKQSVVM